MGKSNSRSWACSRLAPQCFWAWGGRTDGEAETRAKTDPGQRAAGLHAGLHPRDRPCWLRAWDRLTTLSPGQSRRKEGLGPISKGTATVGRPAGPRAAGRPGGLAQGWVGRPVGATLPLLKGPGVRGLGWGSCGPGALWEGQWERPVRDVSTRLALLDAFRPSCSLLCPGSAPCPPVLAGEPPTRGSVPSADLHRPFPESLSEAETPPPSGSLSALETSRTQVYRAQVQGGCPLPTSLPRPPEPKAWCWEGRGPLGSQPAEQGWSAVCRGDPGNVSAPGQRAQTRRQGEQDWA